MRRNCFSPLNYWLCLRSCFRCLPPAEGIREKALHSDTYTSIECES
jgi:hypothetical protein